MTQLPPKQLTTPQYEKARQSAIDRVKGRIGDKPTRQQFQRELSPLWSALDALALIVFVAALAISSSHIIAHMGGLAATSYTPMNAGIAIDRDSFVRIHQAGMIALSEASMLLFMVMHGLTRGMRSLRSNWLSKNMSIPLVLAVIAGVFVFVANLGSGIGLLESLMPPLFTVGLGLHLEHLIVETLRRRKTVDDSYLNALKVYEDATADPTKHPDFEGFLKQAIWDAIINLKANEAWIEAPASVKAAAVRRERVRDEWTNQDYDGVEEWQPQRPTNAQRGDQNGSGSQALIAEDLASTMTTPSANGHGTGVITHE